MSNYPDGFFAKVCDHPDSNHHVLKRYRVYRKRRLDRLLELHESYLGFLNDSSFFIPETEVEDIEEYSDRYEIILNQRRINRGELLTEQVRRHESDRLRSLLIEVYRATTRTFLSNKFKNYGIHPSIRNLALCNSQVAYVDTFPPLNGDDLAETQELMLACSPLWPIFLDSGSIHWGLFTGH